MKKIVPVIVFLFCGCAGAISDTMQSWVGHSESELIGSWGAPTSVYRMNDGTKLLTYAYDRSGYQVPGSVWTDNRGITRYTSPETQGYTATREFTINARGYITTWRWQGY